MLGVFWAIKKFEYESTGRRFTLETDHRALLEIRRTPSYANARVYKDGQKRLKNSTFKLDISPVRKWKSQII